MIGLGVLVAGLSLGTSLAYAEWPWTPRPHHPTIEIVDSVENTAPNDTEIHVPSPPEWVAERLLDVWRTLVSPVDGPTCQFTPTCSGYGRIALRTHGWLLGGLMTAERIMRGHGDFQRYPLRVRWGRIFLVDPVPGTEPTPRDGP